MYSYNKNGIYINDNKFQFNGINLSNVVVVESVQRSLLPSIYNEGVFIEGRAGQILKRSVINNNLITVNLRITETDKEGQEGVVKKLANSLYFETAKKLELRDSSLYNYAQLTSTSEIENENGTRSVVLVFECLDPFNYGDLKTVPINSTFNNVGFDTVGKIICKTNATEIIQVKQRDKVMMTIEHEIAADKDLVIDLEKQLITLNGVSIMKFLSLDSDFFFVNKGVNKIEVTNIASGSIEYVERWL